MPERDRNTVAQRVTLGDGQINLNGTVLDVNGITFTQDGIEAAAFNTEPVVRLDNDAEITATATWEDYDAALQRLFDLSGTPSRNGTVYAEGVLGDAIRQAEATLDRYVTTSTSTDGYTARTYMFDNPWVAYNPHVINYDVMPSVKDAILEEELSAKKNRTLDKFLGEFAPKEAV